MTVVLRNYLSHQALPNTWFMSVNTTPGVRMSPKSFNVFINSMLPLRPHQYGNSLWIIGSHEPLSATVDKILWILENIILPGKCEDSFPNDLGNSSESRFPRKPGNSDFILFLKQPQNISEIRFLGFFGNSESIPFLNDLGTLRKSGFLDFSDSSETWNPEHGN